MTKTELVNAVATTAEVPKTTVKAVLDATLEEIVEAVARGEAVQLAGLGSFQTTERAARTGRNPQTGEEIPIAASKVVKFKAAKPFKDKVNA